MSTREWHATNEDQIETCHTELVGHGNTLFGELQQIPLRIMIAPEVTLRDYTSASIGLGKIFFPKLGALVWAGGNDPGASADLSIFP
jgi:hypothetical protein